MNNYWASKNIATQAVHAAHNPEDYYHLPAVPPIVTAATYYRENRNISLDDKVRQIHKRTYVVYRSPLGEIKFFFNQLNNSYVVA